MKITSWNLNGLSACIQNNCFEVFDCNKPDIICCQEREYILKNLKGNDAPEYVVCADIKTFYATINHAWLLDHVPMDKNVLNQFLQCGHVFAGELFP